jgi:tRNA A-37 threonylcarbamoyl transferase component Bud32
MAMTEEVDSPGEDEPDDLGLRNLLQADPRWTSRYEGWQVIGRGAFATVVKTYCKDLGADIAVKIFKNLDQEDRRRFQQEVRNAQTLDSPGVVRMYSPFWGSPPWIEMEWVHGPNLKQELQRRAAENEPFSTLEGLEIGIAITEVLREAHDKRIVHRDVKPANILLPRSHHPLVKLADFGIARGEGAGRLTHTGTFPGTPQFGSPESFMGDAPLTAAHDVYSLGLCLYLVFSGNRFPWRVAPDAGMRSWMRLHVHVAPGTARRHVPALDRELDDLILRCLKKKPAKRPSTGDVLERLRQIRARVSAEASVTPTDPSAKRIAANRRVLIAAAAGALLVIAALGARLGGSSRAARSHEQPVQSAEAMRTGSGQDGTPRPAPAGQPAAARPADESRPPGASKTPQTPAILPKPGQEAPPAAGVVTAKGNAVEFRNGPGNLTDVRLQVATAGTQHVCLIASPLAPGEETFCSFADFDPEIRPGTKLVEVVISFKSSAGTQSIRQPLR